MILLEERIRKDGEVKPGQVLKVNSFLNHQMDIELFSLMAKEWKRLFSGEKITKILTVEASGIGLACLCAQEFHVPAVFAKKNLTNNLADSVYWARVVSYTHHREYNIIVEKSFLKPEDHILIIDDFLANGSALLGLIGMVEASGATLAGAGIAIEKGFQPGGELVRQKGVRVESLAIIENMDDFGNISFR